MRGKYASHLYAVSRNDYVLVDEVDTMLVIENFKPVVSTANVHSQA